MKIINEVTHRNRDVKAVDENDIEELKKMASDELPVGAMAGQLGRTPNSVRMRLKAMGLWTPRPASKAWNKEDEAALVEGYEAGASFEDLAEQFGRFLFGFRKQVYFCVLQQWLAQTRTVL